MTIHISEEMARAIESALRYDVRIRGVRNYGRDGIVNFPSHEGLPSLVSNREALEFFDALINGTP